MKVEIEPMPIGPQQQGVINALSQMGATDVRLLNARVERVPYSVIVSRDNITQRRQIPDLRWHISVAGVDAVAPWEHLVAIGHEVRPGVCFVVGVPPRSWWMNVHPHTLHLWEVDDANLTAQWRAERQGHRPT